MPSEEALGSQRQVVVLRRVEHHLHDTFDVTIRRFQGAYIHPELSSDRRTNLAGVEFLAFDLAALQHVFGERAEDGLLPDLEAESLHVADEAALKMPGGS